MYSTGWVRRLDEFDDTLACSSREKNKRHRHHVDALTPKHSQYFLRQEDLRQWQPVRCPFAFEDGSAATRGLRRARWDEGRG